MSSVPPRVRVVTDSTAGLPRRLTAPLGVGVVPLSVSSGSTSQPAPAGFAAAWEGADEVVSVHLSSFLSGTYQGAVVASRAAGMPVEVIDSGTTAMGLGFIALAAARVAARGGSLAEVAAAAREAAQQTDSVFLLDSVDALHRGGRLAGASALVGSALAVKPVLHVVGGKLVPLERVRTHARGLARLAALGIARAEGVDVEIAVQHHGAADRAESLARVLDESLGSRLIELEVLEVSPVVAAHVGPGCVGVVVHRL